MNYCEELEDVIKGLEYLIHRGNHPIQLLDENPLVVDALRGSMWELKYRGTLTEYLGDIGYGHQTFQDLAWHTIQRLQDACTKPKWPFGTYGNYIALEPIGLGTFGWSYDIDVIVEAMKGGIRFIDTAESYGYGKVEKALGLVLRGWVGESMIIATKVSRNHMSYQATLNAAKRSADVLGASLNLYQIHWPVMPQLYDTMKAMVQLWHDKRVDNVGVCNFSIDQLLTAQSLAQSHESKFKVQAIQVRYNLADRGIERALLPYCKEHGITVIAYSPLGQGFNNILAHDKEHVLHHIAKVYGCTEAQVALAWIMSHGAIPIPRTNNISHAKEIAATKGLKLAKSMVTYLDNAFPIQE